MIYNLSRWIVPVIFSMVTVTVTADTQAVVAHCRSLAQDQSGYVECLDLLQVQADLNLEDIESTWIKLLDDASSAQVSESTQQIDKLLSTGDLYRKYRGQQCELASLGLDRVSGVTALAACRISMDRNRTTELQRLLIEYRVRLSSGNFYRGYYLQTESASLFQSCDLRQDWRVIAAGEIAQRLAESYAALTTEQLELLYVEFRGAVEESDTDTAVAVKINDLNLIRPMLDRDCQAATAAQVSVADGNNAVSQATTGPDLPEPLVVESAEEPTTLRPDANIDELGSAGFLYGYFGTWTSLCAADEQLACKAHTADNFSSAGNWQLEVDRSAQRNWRVRVIPQTDSHIIGSRVQVAIDGAAMFTVPVDSEQLLIGSALSIASGDRALQLLNAMRSGATIELNWNTQEQATANLAFSLSGVSLALQYFDNHGGQ